MTAEPVSMKELWDTHHKTMRAIRDRLAQEGATIQVDMIIRDKAASERYAKRMARKRR